MMRRIAMNPVVISSTSSDGDRPVTMLVVLMAKYVVSDHNLTNLQLEHNSGRVSRHRARTLIRRYIHCCLRTGENTE